jgi:hypothetical protein
MLYKVIIIIVWEGAGLAGKSKGDVSCFMLAFVIALEKYGRS